MAETLESDFTNPRCPIEQEIANLSPWFHNLHLPGDIQTAPSHKLGDFPAANWELIAPNLPQDMSSMTALDIGCNAGFYSFELARRGAKVTAIDSDGHYLRQARWAAGKLGLEEKITFSDSDLFSLLYSDLSFDIVFFLGLFYHLRYPLLGLDLAAAMTKRHLVFQTMTLPGDEEICETPHDLDYEQRGMLNNPLWPHMAFVEKRLAGDPTNWWVPNAACVEAMLRAAGLRIIKKICREFYLCTPVKKPALPFELLHRK